MASHPWLTFLDPAVIVTIEQKIRKDGRWKDENVFLQIMNFIDSMEIVQVDFHGVQEYRSFYLYHTGHTVFRQMGNRRGRNLVRT